MSVTVRDRALRCDRCQRVVLGTKHVAIVEGDLTTRLMRLCTRCRSELADTIRIFAELT